jgi:uncharacterized protein
MRRAAASPARVVAVAVAVALAATLAGSARAADGDIPAAPTAYVTDRAGFLSPPAAASLEQRLGAYERGTGHQVWVWIDRTTAPVPLEDWTVRAFDKWRVGRKGLDDGVVLFLFSDDRKVRIEVGYGLEGLIPDARAGRIIQSDIVPRIRAGDRDGAVNAGVDALMAAIGGTPDTGAPAAGKPSAVRGIVSILGFIIVLILVMKHPWLLLFMGGGGRGGGFGGGGFGGGGGGGFGGGGGGRSGGGGASGSW